MGAQQAVRAGHHEIGRLTLQAGQLKSRQRVALAGAGVDIGTGSAAEIQASSDLLKEIDVNTIASNAARSAWGYRVQGVNYQTEAITKKSAANAISPAMALGTSLMGSATSVASSWYQMNKAGMFGSSKPADKVEFDYSGNAEWNRWATGG